MCSFDARNRGSTKLPVKRKASELGRIIGWGCARPICAVKGSLGHSSNRGLANWWALTRPPTGTSRHASGWAGEKVARCGRSSRTPSLKRRQASLEGTSITSFDGRSGTNTGAIPRKSETNEFGRNIRLSGARWTSVDSPFSTTLLCPRQTSRGWICSLWSWRDPLRCDPALLMAHMITSTSPTVNRGA